MQVQVDRALRGRRTAALQGAVGAAFSRRGIDSALFVFVHSHAPQRLLAGAEEGVPAGVVAELGAIKKCSVAAVVDAVDQGLN